MGRSNLGKGSHDTLLLGKVDVEQGFNVEGTEARAARLMLNRMVLKELRQG